MARVSIAMLERLRVKPNKTKCDKKAIAYYTRLHRAQPAWLTDADRAEINRIYRDAHRRRLVVDHIVPLGSTLVCGLHVPWNLRAITHAENQVKSNTWWPDCPIEQQELKL